MQEEENNKETKVEEKNIQSEKESSTEKTKNGVSLTKYIVVLIILILVIIFLFVFSVNIEEAEETEENVIDTTNTVIITQEEDETEDIETTEITDQDEIEDIIEEIEESYAEIFENADVYMEGDFDIDTISNELILKLAWNAIVDEAIEEDDGENYLEEGITADGVEITALGDTGGGTITITQEKMEEKILEIFGEDLEYTDNSFDNSPHEWIWGGWINCADGVYEVTYENNEYIAEYVEGGGAGYPELKEYAYEAIEYEDSIEIYVKMYIIKEGDESEEYKLHYYDGYDFAQDDQTGLGEEIEISGDEISETELENIETTYKYTFAIDSETGDYYLSGFCEVTE